MKNPLKNKILEIAHDVAKEMDTEWEKEGKNVLNDGNVITKRKEIIVNVENSDKMEELITENESLKENLRIIGELELNRKRSELGAPESIKTLSELKVWQNSQNDGNNSSSQIGRGSSGRSSLNQNGEQKDGNTFNSNEEMVDFIMQKCEEGNEKYKEIRDQMLHKTLNGLKDEANNRTVFYEAKGEIIKDFLERKNAPRRKALSGESK